VHRDRLRVQARAGRAEEAPLRARAPLRLELPEHHASTSSALPTFPGTKYGETTRNSDRIARKVSARRLPTWERRGARSFIVALSGSSETNRYLALHSMGQSPAARRLTASLSRSAAASRPEARAPMRSSRASRHAFS